jgi:Helitron helicase-like domain at N-terminus
MSGMTDVGISRTGRNLTCAISCCRTSRLISELDGTLPCEASLNATLNFEQSCKDVRVSHCLCCRQVRLQLSMNVRRGVCHECSNLKDKNYYIDRNLLPIWYKEGHVQYGVPPELTCLTLAEKMLIQLASPFIPLQHIKNGVFGLSGHVCSFEQDVEKFVTTLPRHPSEVTVLKVLKEVAVEVGGCETRTSVFTVRRKNVGDALKWLKKYNIEYRNIPIDMSALDWLGGDEGSLDSVLTINSCSPGQETDTAPLDLGPSPSLTMGTQQSGDNIQTFGYVNESLVTHLSSEDTDIHNQLVQEIQGSSRKKEIEVQWPSTGPVAINEYSTTRIFARAFPWLFPGGVGDAKDAEDQLQKWGQRLLYYEDGRFAKDKYFTFYAYNYIVRHRNAKSGSWFLKGFNRNGPETLAELQASIRSGNLEFINRLMYYNKHVTGSNSYWYQKRAEVYTWINHHVEVGNGPPNLFITLSCAEYYWPDMLRVILERMEIAGDTRVKDCYQGSPKLTELLNDYTIVVQEFFQVRFENWMEHFGRPVFGIRHYWGRYEFAPGRGQIHIHLLAIRKDQAIFKLLYDDLRQPDGKALRDRRLAKWAEDELGLTASVADGFEGRSAQPKDSPCSVRFCDLSLVGSPHTDVTQGLLNDQQNLIKFCQVHDCNGFCLRKKGNKR